MWLPLLAMIIGFLIIFFFNLDIPHAYTEYLAIAVIAGLDSIIGAVNSSFEKRFDDKVFVSGFFVNIIIAVGLLYLGNLLSVPYIGLAIIVALVIRIFNNFGYIRRALVSRYELKKVKSDAEENTVSIESSLDEVASSSTNFDTEK